MVLESTFRLASDVTLAEHGEALFLLLPASITQAPLRFPLELKNSLERLRSDFVSSPQMEDLFTEGASGDALITRVLLS